MSKISKVNPEWRTNSLHENGGGYQVFVVYKDFNTKVYDNVQHPHGYIRKIKSGSDWQAGNIIDVYYKEHNETN
tara:strand:- start:100 stop:321 length:222 start_codon:yes stop_codon:yes gene_type:complete